MSRLILFLLLVYSFQNASSQRVNIHDVNNKLDYADDLYYQDKPEKALEIIKPLRKKIENLVYSNNRLEFMTYKSAFLQERQIYMDAEEYGKMIELDRKEAERLKRINNKHDEQWMFYFDVLTDSVNFFLISENYSYDSLKKSEKDFQSILDLYTSVVFKDELVQEIISTQVEGLQSTISSMTKLRQNSRLANKVVAGENQSALNEMNQSEVESNQNKDALYFSQSQSQISNYSLMGLYNRSSEKLKKLSDELSKSNIDLAEHFEQRYLIEYSLYNNLFLGKKYIEAEKVLLNLLKLIKNQQNKDAIKLFSTLNSATLYYYQIGNYNKALEFALESLNVEGYPFKFYQFQIIGQIYFEQQKFDEAILWYKKYLESLLNAKETNTELIIPSANWMLSLANIGTKNLNEAEKFALNSLEGYKKDPTNQYFVKYCKANLALIRGLKGNWDLANKEMADFIESFEEDFLESLLFATEDSRASNLSKNVYNQDFLFYFISKQGDIKGAITGTGYDQAILAKKMLLNTAETIKKKARFSSNDELRKAEREWKKVDQLLKKPNIDNRDSLMDYARLYEKEIITRAKSEILKSFVGSKVRWKQIQDNLKSDEAAIEFVSFSPYVFESNRSRLFYGAYVLTKESEFPKYFNLFEEDELNGILESQKSNSTKQNISKLYSQDGSKLFKLIWVKIDKVVSEKKKIFYSTSGILNNISFNALPYKNSASKLRDKYKLLRLYNTRSLVSNSTKSNGYKNALLFGDIAYDVVGKTNVSMGTSNNTRGNDFESLRGTYEEILELAKILEDNGIQAEYLSKEKASEENFYANVKNNPDIIHLATHAFYLKPENEDSFFITDKLGLGILKAEKNPMNRSGLALSNANYFWKYGETIENNKDDGILTANELSGLDLSETKLVVLSACETALGQSYSNEGVFGLQRGLKMAGVDKLILSLWKVDDNVTKEFMVYFYDFVISQKMTLPNAFSKAQNQIRLKYDDPYYWAAFVLIQ